MSVVQRADMFNNQELQIWNNAAFDNGESEDSTAMKGNWSNIHSLCVNHSLESDGSKENVSPGSIKTPVPSYLKSSIPVNPLQANSSIKNSQAKPLKSVSKLEFLEKATRRSKDGVQEEELKRDERKIDMEIEEIEKEISRLSSRLEALRLEKIELKSKAIEKRGRIVPAKFMEQKQSFKNPESIKKTEEQLLSSAAKPKLNSRRGVSLGPAEIYSATKSRQSLGKPAMITPGQSIQNRRKSCFWKLQEIDELKVTKERGKSSSLSPKSRKTAAHKVQPPKQAMTTVAAFKKTVKKEDAFLSLIQPKKLFKDGEKSSKKPLKPGRFVASRYSQIQNDARKRSFPENDKEESTNTGDKRRVSRENFAKTGTNQKNEQTSCNRVKKRWEIPTELVICKEGPSPPPSISKVSEVLPKIRTVQIVDESPRDSGAAKRVAELTGRKSFFRTDGGEGEDDDDDVEMEETDCSSVCQVLRFDVTMESDEK